MYYMDEQDGQDGNGVIGKMKWGGGEGAGIKPEA
jgi:hypothetical protein